MKTPAVLGTPSAIAAAALAPSSGLTRVLLPALGWSLLAILAQYAAYSWDAARPLVAVYLLALVQLAHQERWRWAFYPGLLVGFCLGMLQLGFFYSIFSFGAAALWLVFAVWIGLFVALARLALRHFGRWGLVLLPILWTGLEYFRSELYYLRFAWLTPGYAFAQPPWEVSLGFLGVYGTGTVLLGMVCAVQALKGARAREIGLILLLGALMILPHWHPAAPAPNGGLKVAGVQMEFPSETEALLRLRELQARAPEAELVVLPEYTFPGPVPPKVRNWCRQHQKYLIAGGKEPAGGDNFYNLTYVIGPSGEVVFQQAKSVPIQFFKDGLPAPQLQVWNSPWGRIGLPICYDLSYTRVTDALVRQGAQALIVPTMDVVDWGLAQHRLHGRVAPVRAAEYGIPVFRVASSGISQLIDRHGVVQAAAPCPGDGAIIRGELPLAAPGRVPPLRWLAPVCTALTVLLAAVFIAIPLRHRFFSQSQRIAGAGQHPRTDPRRGAFNGSQAS